MGMERNAADHASLQAVASGDTDALGPLAARHERSMLGLARGLLGGSVSDAEDAVQITWANVIRSSGRFKGRSSVKTWLFHILVNECRDLAKRRRIVANVESAQDRVAATSEQANDDDDTGRIRRAVLTLPQTQREILLLCFHNGLTHEQAASVLGIPAGTLKTRLRASYAALRQLLATEAPA